MLGSAASFAVLFAIWPFVDPAGAPWERGLLRGAHDAFPGAAWAAFYYVGELGRSVGVAAVTVAAAAWWLLRRLPWRAAVVLADALLLALASPVTGYGARLGKDLFDRPRPDLFPGHATYPNLPEFAFPSGHAMVAVAFYGFLAYLVLSGARSPAVRGIGWAAWGLLALAIGWSRIVLGDHWPSDVLAGYASGACVLLGMALGTRAWRRAAAGGDAAGEGAAGE